MHEDESWNITFKKKTQDSFRHRHLSCTKLQSWVQTDNLFNAGSWYNQKNIKFVARNLLCSRNDSSKTVLDSHVLVSLQDVEQLRVATILRYKMTVYSWEVQTISFRYMLVFSNAFSSANQFGIVVRLDQKQASDFIEWRMSRKVFEG